ncbi:hypothetical protein OH76DRAFT_1422602 [Lentinus brumalis]|uniref:Uncharacterized protein n=1 Tax=Lentinus brumalis TaxID=2498619 RepID=A0A371CPR2_9APHY|nr:hypothetical protein OH76DRAFT_1422602 [Polyporus brumalis]
MFTLEICLDAPSHLPNYKLTNAVVRDYHNGKKIIKNIKVKEMTKTFLDGEELHSVHETPVVCADICCTGQSYEDALKLLAELDLVNSCFAPLGCLPSTRCTYGLLCKVYDCHCAQYKSQVAIAALNKYNLWEGRKIMINRWSPPHCNQHNPHYSWFWQINTVVLEWEGQHHFMVYLTHEALWKHLDVPEGSSTVAS